MSKKINSFQGLVYSTNPDAIPNEEPEEMETLAPKDQRLKIKLDSKRRAGKIVTLVENFVGSDADLADLGKKLKTKCGTGGSAKEGIIIIQGDYKGKIEGWLKEWGYR